jgi:regulator of protease activity HflC (stomatin/prohibitin superfamily)
VGDALVRFAEWLRELWPFRIVDAYEHGVVTILGRYWKTVGPGVYPCIPWFTDVVGYSVVPAIVQTPRLDIELQDGTAVSFVASATVRVTDVRLAILTVDNYTETTVELLSAVLAEKLAEVDTGRLDPEKKRRLLADLVRWANEEASEYGIEISKLRFTTFIKRPRFYRVLGDAPLTLW